MWQILICLLAKLNSVKKEEEGRGLSKAWLTSCRASRSSVLSLFHIWPLAEQVASNYRAHWPIFLPSSTFSLATNLLQNFLFLLQAPLPFPCSLPWSTTLLINVHLLQNLTTHNIPTTLDKCYNRSWLSQGFGVGWLHFLLASLSMSVFVLVLVILVFDGWLVLVYWWLVCSQFWTVLCCGWFLSLYVGPGRVDGLLVSRWWLWCYAVLRTMIVCLSQCQSRVGCWLLVLDGWLLGFSWWLVVSF